MKMSSNENKTTENDRLYRILINVLGFVLSLLIVIAYFSFNDLKERQARQEEKISYLYQDKVSRAEFREEINNMRFQIEGTKTDILARQADVIARQDTMKSDILARIDLLIPHLTAKGK